MNIIPEYYYLEAARLLRYSPESGLFTWEEDRRPRTKAGDVAGRSVSGYAYISIEGRSLSAHRVAWYIMTGNIPVMIDHINHLRYDNRWCNLRECTNAENLRNKRMSARNKSGVVGVRHREKHDDWAAGICVNRKTIHLGYYTKKSEAIKARKQAEQKYFGEFTPTI